MTGSLSLEDTIATALAGVHTTFVGGDNSYSNKDVLQLILDEEGPEALVDAVLRAAGVVPAESAGHDTGGLRECLRQVEAIRLAHRSLPEDSSIETIAEVLREFAPARDALEDAVSDFLAAVDGEVPATRCTGLTARWCPIHGACTCQPIEGERREGPGDDDGCPLHDPLSEHPVDGEAPAT